MLQVLKKYAVHLFNRELKKDNLALILVLLDNNCLDLI